MTGHHSGGGPPAGHRAPPGPAAGPAFLTPLQAFRRLDSGPRGLTDAEAEARLARHGENTPPAPRPASPARRAAAGLRDPFTAVLLCLGLISAVVTSWATAGVILALVAVSCALRAAGEYRADRSMAALRELAGGTATVLRRADDRADRPLPREVPVEELVPGDVVRLGPGDLVPADVLLLRATGLRVQEAAFTGESEPVAKHPRDRPPGTGAGPPEPAHVCFQGSGVVTGAGTALVLETGPRVRLAAESRGVRRERSRFDRSVHGISWILVRFMLLTPPLVLMADSAVNGSAGEKLPFVIAMAVGLTPEMLPVVVTTALARSAVLLARDTGVIVRRLPALHDLGAMDVLCLDKTGTLTEDRPVVDRAVDARGRPDRTVLDWAAVNASHTLLLAEVPVPDPLDEALLAAADEEPAAEDGPAGAAPVAVLPFDPVRRLSAALVARPGRPGRHTLVVKGAVEEVLRRCDLAPEERERLLATAARESAGGLRVVAVATAERAATTRPPTGDETGLELRGFVCLRDALSPTAAAALRTLRKEHIQAKVLTGDHPATALRVCQELGVPSGPALTGEDIDGLDDAALARSAGRTTVFARCTPHHKARVVTALRAAGHTTGFLGDGVNDVAALRTADVGICPRDAVATARSGADVVLADKDLTAIGGAVRAGRRGGVNIATYLRTALSSNLGNAVAMLTAALLLPFVPMLPAQVLAQNLLFDAAQLTFAFDRCPPRGLRRPAVLRTREILRFITLFGLLNAAADLATFGVLALAARGADPGSAEALFHAGWFTENLLTQALVMVLLRARPKAPGRRRPGPVALGAGALAATGVLLPLTPWGGALGLCALPPLYYASLAGVLAVYAPALALVRARYRRRHGV